MHNGHGSKPRIFILYAAYPIRMPTAKKINKWIWRTESCLIETLKRKTKLILEDWYNLQSNREINLPEYLICYFQRKNPKTGRSG